MSSTLREPVMNIALGRRGWLPSKSSLLAGIYDGYSRSAYRHCNSHTHHWQIYWAWYSLLLPVAPPCPTSLRSQFSPDGAPHFHPHNPPINKKLLFKATRTLRSCDSVKDPIFEIFDGILKGKFDLRDILIELRWWMGGWLQKNRRVGLKGM